jgi:Hydantoin racemase
MLRIKAIAPLHLSHDELARRQRRYDLLGGDTVHIELTNLDPAAPERLDSAEDITRSEQAVGAIVRATDAARYDGILPDCVLDPAIGEPGPHGMPVFGILRLACGHLASLGVRFAAVTRNAAIAAELRRRLDEYRLAESLDSVRVLDTDFCLIADDQAWAQSIEPVTAALQQAGVGVLVNGCSAVNLPQDRLDGVPVVDPTKLAIRLIADAHREGLLRSAAESD